MDVKDLISHFSTSETVPIDVQDDVIPLLASKFKFEVWFWPMPSHVLDGGIYRGMMTQWEDIPYGDEVRTHVSIQYAEVLPPEWQRLICCKELIHILDPIELRVSNESAFNRLIEKIVLPPEMMSAADGVRVWNDRVAIWQAMAVLFPWATRELYLTPFQEEKITIEEIASEVDLPVEFVAVVMDEEWVDAYHSFTR